MDATREEAVARAQKHIDALVDAEERRLNEPRNRPNREQYGLPRELGQHTIRIVGREARAASRKTED